MFYVIPSMLIVVGLVIAAFGLRNVIQAHASTSWRSTKGKIAQSRVEVVENPGGGDEHEHHGPSYRPNIHYTYRVANREHTGTRIFVGDRFSGNESYAAGYVARYPVGRSVTVYYDPEDPSDAVLERGLVRKTFFPLVFGVGFTFFGAWFCLLIWLSSE